MTALTSPEWAAEAALLRKANRGDGCRTCRWRTETHGWADCGLEPQLKFPRCLQEPGGFIRDLGKAA